MSYPNEIERLYQASLMFGKKKESAPIPTVTATKKTYTRRKASDFAEFNDDFTIFNGRGLGVLNAYRLAMVLRYSAAPLRVLPLVNLSEFEDKGDGLGCQNIEGFALYLPLAVVRLLAKAGQTIALGHGKPTYSSYIAEALKGEYNLESFRRKFRSQLIGAGISPIVVNEIEMGLAGVDVVKEAFVKAGVITQ